MNARSNGFLEAMMDFTFTHFVTIRVIAVLYGLALAAVAFSSLMLLIFLMNAANFFVAFIFTPLFFCLGVLLVRMYLEVTVVLFRIAENSSALREMGTQWARQPAAGAAVSADQTIPS